MKSTTSSGICLPSSVQTEQSALRAASQPRRASFSPPLSTLKLSRPYVRTPAMVAVRAPVPRLWLPDEPHGPLPIQSTLKYVPALPTPTNATSTPSAASPGAADLRLNDREQPPRCPVSANVLAGGSSAEDPLSRCSSSVRVRRRARSSREPRLRRARSVRSLPPRASSLPDGGGPPSIRRRAGTIPSRSGPWVGVSEREHQRRPVPSTQGH